MPWFRKKKSGNSAPGRAAGDTTESKRVAYRLGYETAKERIANEIETVRNYQGRSIVLLSVSALVASIGVSGIDGPVGDASGCWHVIGWVLLGLGLSSGLVGAVALNRPLEGIFEWDPDTLVEYGDERDDYPTDDDLFRDLACAGSEMVRNASDLCRKRYPWLWASLVGLLLTFMGATLLSAVAS